MLTSATQLPNEVAVEQDIMMPMRDGIRLAADVYRPVQSEPPHPVLLERTPYNKQAPQRQARGRKFANHGYIVVFQDCRGRFRSGGNFTKYVNEGSDGYDTLVWLGQQPWCNGQVGTFGVSYGAHTQTASASLNPPHLASMAVDSGGFSNAYLSGCRHSGAFEFRQAVWAHQKAQDSQPAMTDPTVKAALSSEDLRAWFHPSRTPWKRGHSPLRWVSAYEDFFFDILTRTDFDDYWGQVGLCAERYYAQFPDVPVLVLGSWYDPYARTSCDTYVGLSRLKNASIRLVMGPWTHGAHATSYAGDVDMGAAAPLPGNLAQDYDDFLLRWFDFSLKQVENGVESTPQVQLFVMGGGSGRRTNENRLKHGGCWRAENEWPLSQTQLTRFYFHADGSLSPKASSALDSRSHYRYDPTQPVPSIGGCFSSPPILPGGAFDQVSDSRFYGCQPPYLPLASRHDVLVFQTVPLAQDTEVTGPIVVKLWASSSALDTDFTAKLVDVYPPNSDNPAGFAMNLTDGIIRARYRNSWERAELMEPGKVYQFTITLHPTSNLFLAGHRIRLDISSSNYPRFDINPNTGEPLGLSRDVAVARNSVFHDANRPSHVVLPIIPT